MRAAATVLRTYTHAMIHTAAAWDLLGASGILPPWWPPVGYVLAAAGIAAGSIAVLLTVLTARRNMVVDSTEVTAANARVTRSPVPVPRVSAGGQLLALGILLAAWLLRGHAEIPPDLPIVAAEILAAALYAVFSLRSRGRPAAAAD